MTLTQEEAQAEVLAAGQLCTDLNGDGPGLQGACPCCGAGGVMIWRPDDPVWRCANGCDPSQIATELHVKSTRTWNEATTADELAIDQARRELEAIYGLDELGVTITGARIVRRGTRASAASADIYLNTGDEINLESLRDAARPGTLLPELAASVGATPALKQPQCLKAVTLLRRIAEHHVTFSEDEIARDWGTSYLQSVQTLDVDIDDQAERWGAFSTLHQRDPRFHQSTEGGSVAAATIVLRHTDGVRYVRAGWFRDVVRLQDAAISPQELAHRMERIGWHRRGQTGRIKATAPGRTDSLAWSFYLVAHGWEDER